MKTEQKIWLERIGKLYFPVMLLYLGVMILLKAYVSDLYLTPDSVEYLKEAEALLAGKGFYSGALAGYTFWFANWPIGYPVMIALTAALLHRNVYLASKVLTILLIAVFMVLLCRCFRKDAWMYGLFLLNAGVLSIFCYTWSETPFMIALFVFTYALGGIVTRPDAGRKWYVLLAAGGIAAFLLRYFGIMTLLCGGVVFACYLAAVCKKKLQKQAVSAAATTRLRRLFVSLLVQTLVVLAYFLMNRMMNGAASGVSRSTFSDDPVTLTQNLFDAFFAEIFNVFGVAAPQLMSGYSMGAKAAVMAAVFLCCGVLMVHGLRHHKSYAVFFLNGLFYYALFIWIRFHSTMDPFNSRFFAPGSMLLFMGLISFAAERLRGDTKTVLRLAMLFLLVLACISQTKDLRSARGQQTAYRQFQAIINNDYYEVPEKSAVLYYADNPTYDKKTGFLRPDILFVDGIDSEETMDEVFRQYRNSDYLCIRKDVLQSVILSHPESFDRSVVTFFSTALQESTQNEMYVTIDCKTEKPIASAGMYHQVKGK